MLLNLFYLLAFVLLSPWLLWRCVSTGRYRRELVAKLFGRVSVKSNDNRSVAWFHAVSVGEVNLLATLVPAFRKRYSNWLVIVSSTTDTGLAEARKWFPDLNVIAWPFDFTWAVSAVLDVVRPQIVMLTESELWPNFLAEARRRNIPVVVVNARMSPRSFSRLKRVASLARRFLFANITRFAVQEDEYAERLQQLGVPPEKLVVTGSIKYDGAATERDTPRFRTLQSLLGLPSHTSSLVWVAGSTHAPEEEIVLRVLSRLQERFPHLRLILVPRHPDRFEEVVRLVEQSGLPFVRRSQIAKPLREMPAVVVLDTIGELGAAWGLADIGFTGGSLDGQRGGQSMIEPAGYGVPCLFGPHVWNFKDAAKRLIESQAAVMVRNELELETELEELIVTPELRQKMGESARRLILRQQGATHKTLESIAAVLEAILPHVKYSSISA